MVVVARVAWTHRTPDSLSVRPPRHGPWTRHNEQGSSLETKAKPSTPKDDVALTEKDEEETQTQTARDRSRSPIKAAAKAKEPVEAPSLKISKTELQRLEQEGWQRVNQEGNGDCGYRSITAALAWAKDGVQLSPEESKREGGVLRSQALSHIRRNLTKYKPCLIPDVGVPPEATVDESVHNQKIQEFMTKHALPTTWINGILL